MRTATVKTSIIFLLMVSIPMYGVDQTAYQKGSDMGNLIKGKYGSKESINNGMAQPFMSNTQLTTVDGSKSFDAQMQCPSSSKTVGITFLPAGGNDYRLIIKQDTDLDGTFDYSYDTSVLGRAVSGVCTNGIISCSPSGSWTGCAQYLWKSINRKISLELTPPGSTQIGACYCSNASCNISTLSPQIYETIGGGIGAAIMHENNQFLLSKSKYEAAEMTYYLYGQDRTSCSGLSSSGWDQYGERNPQQYYNAQTPPNISIAEVAMEQGGDPNSYYSMVQHQNQVAYNDGGSTIGLPSSVECVATKLPQGVINQQACVEETWNGATWCNFGRAGMDGRFSGDSKAQISNLPITVMQGQSLYAVAEGHISICDDDNSYVHLKFTGGVSGEYNYGCADGLRSGKTIPIVENATSQMQVTIEDFSQRHSGGGVDFYDIHLYASNNVQTETITTNENNTCPSNCTLVDEVVCDAYGNNCIQSVLGGVQNSVNQTFCMPYSSQLTHGSVCADGNQIMLVKSDNTMQVLSTGSGSWLYAKRRYECEPQTIDIDTDTMIRAGSTATGNKAEQTITYVDENGQYKTIRNVPQGDECPTPICTVKADLSNTQQFSDGTNASQLPTGGLSATTSVRTCTKATPASTPVCQLQPGEEMLEDCSCTGSTPGFQQAISILGAVSEAAKDMICSQD